MWLIDRDTIYREPMTKGDQRANALFAYLGTEVWTNFDPAGDRGDVMWTESNCRHVSPAPASGRYFWRSYS